MIVTKNEFAIISHRDDIKSVQLDWQGYVPTQQFREALSSGVDVAKKHNLTGWLGNTRLLGVISVEDQQWTNEVWFPSALSAGIKYIALVVPEDIFSQVSVDNIIDNAEGDFQTRYFNSVEEAAAWLKEMCA